MIKYGIFTHSDNGYYMFAWADDEETMAYMNSFSMDKKIYSFSVGEINVGP